MYFILMHLRELIFLICIFIFFTGYVAYKSELPINSKHGKNKYIKIESLLDKSAKVLIILIIIAFIVEASYLTWFSIKYFDL